MMGRMRGYRIYALTDDVTSLKEKHACQFSHYDCRMFLEGRHNRAYEKSGGWSGYSILQGISPADSLSQAANRVAGSDIQSVVLSRRKSERLEYFFQPRSEEVLRAVVENAARLLELIDRHNSGR